MRLVIVKDYRFEIPTFILIIIPANLVLLALRSLLTRHCGTRPPTGFCSAKFYLPSCAFEDERFLIQLDSRRAINLIELALIEFKLITIAVAV